MPAKRPSSPWRILWITPGGPHTTKYRSERAAYDAINEERQKIADGLSQVTRIRVEKWDPGLGDYALFDNEF